LNPIANYFLPIQCRHLIQELLSIAGIPKYLSLAYFLFSYYPPPQERNKETYYPRITTMQILDMSLPAGDPLHRSSAVLHSPIFHEGEGVTPL
jgi:hypothetical protein